MKKVLQQLKQYKRDTFFCIGLTTLEVIMEILLPFVTARIIDLGLEAGNLSAVYRYGAIMVAMAFFSLICAALAGKFAASASSGLSANLREAIYNNIQTFSFSNIDKCNWTKDEHTNGLIRALVMNFIKKYKELDAELKRKKFAITIDVYKRQDLPGSIERRFAFRYP